MERCSFGTQPSKNTSLLGRLKLPRWVCSLCTACRLHINIAFVGAASQDHKPRPCCRYWSSSIPFPANSPCYNTVKVFDLLYLTLAKHSDGEKTTIFRNVPLKNRKKTLRDFGLFTEIKGRFEFALEREGTTASDVEEYLQEIVETR